MSLNQVHITTPEQVSINFKIAGLGSRASANIIDWVILILINVGITFSLIKFSEAYPNTDPLSEAASSYLTAIMIVLLFLLLWGYFVFFEFFSSGRTPGKMIVGIKVIQDNGQSITFLASAVRNLFRIIDFLPVLFLLGIIMIFLHSRHKRIGDLAAGTLVIYQPKSKRKKKNNPLEKVIERRLNTQQIALDLNEWSKQKIGIREWELLNTYMIRRASLSQADRENIARQVAGILFPLLGVDLAYEHFDEVENYLFALYLQVREDWQ
ncbi:RDD family protein [Desulfosporosinus meridiei]|uniref:Putative membrane protein/domain protein n=1 Tax=Desulfosporosinus meridiei (strain ATCC BAA-275 / DSM 13257 / KCTC 12902 / NCIMB 13706 / S10) TaxID=768704 RepID=J7IU37_DESMD|nr:RDD family protein [Desulfosporosinus meridiei]AFQ45235.1 putative membrane protein/domain protein [Desulfosporosinus meridiei DSM 13257]